jgi:uncharacterized protein (TIGR02147 family)
MTVFEGPDYKQFVLARIQTMPRRGRGQLSRIAKLLNIHTTMVTHIFRGKSHLSIEQALKLAQYFGMNELETEYFVELIHLARAANTESREYYSVRLTKLKSRVANLADRLAVKKVLQESDQAIFYSAWYFSAIRLLTAIEGFQNREVIGTELNLPMRLVNRVVEFLLRTGLCLEEDGQLRIGEASTYVDKDALLVSRHHGNWRLKVMEQFNDIQSEELIYTNPITISKSDFDVIREEIFRFIERFRQIADPSPAEELCCLNIDWIRVRRYLART